MSDIEERIRKLKEKIDLMQGTEAEKEALLIELLEQCGLKVKVEEKEVPYIV